MLCGGVTVYTPLKRFGCGPGKTVGILGVGGLGHFGVLFAKAMGADKVIGISRSKSKEAECLELGADKYIATADDPNWLKDNARTMDLIICTISGKNMPLQDYLKLLKPFGNIVIVGAPEDNLPSLSLFPFLLSSISISGSAIGSPDTIREMLEFASKHNIKPWIETRKMADANTAIVDLVAGKPRFRYVLVDDEPESEIRAAVGESRL